MLQSDRASESSERNRRIRKTRRPPLFWILRGLMIVSFCCFLVFLGQLVIPKIQAKSVSSRIPVPGTSDTVKATEGTPMPKPEAADKTAASEEPAEAEEAVEETVFSTEETAPISEDFQELRRRELLPQSQLLRREGSQRQHLPLPVQLSAAAGYRSPDLRPPFRDGRYVWHTEKVHGRNLHASACTGSVPYGLCR